MTQFDPDQPDDDETPDPNDPAQLRRQLRDALKANKELGVKVAEGATVHKENAFLKSGLPDTPMTRFFRDNYQGDITEDAIKTAAAELGIIPPVDAAAQQEVASINTQSNAIIGGVPPVAPDSNEAMWKEFEATVASGGDGEKVLRKYGHATASDDH